MRLAIFLAFMLTTSAAHANLSNSGWGPIVAIKAWNDRLEVQMEMNHNCGGEPRNHFRLYTDHDNYEVAASLLMTAYARGSDINVRYGCWGEGGGNTRIIGVRAR